MCVNPRYFSRLPSSFRVSGVLERIKFATSFISTRFAQRKDVFLFKSKPFLCVSNRRFLNGKELTDGGKVKVSAKDFVYRLDLSDVDESMVGKIKVVATNENGTDEKEVKE